MKYTLNAVEQPDSTLSSGQRRIDSTVHKRDVKDTSGEVRTHALKRGLELESSALTTRPQTPDVLKVADVSVHKTSF
jgi:hypothetical protein